MWVYATITHYKVSISQRQNEKTVSFSHKTCLWCTVCSWPFSHLIQKRSSAQFNVIEHHGWHALWCVGALWVVAAAPQVLLDVGGHLHHVRPHAGLHLPVWELHALLVQRNRHGQREVSLTKTKVDLQSICFNKLLYSVLLYLSSIQWVTGAPQSRSFFDQKRKPHYGALAVAQRLLWLRNVDFVISWFLVLC